MGTFIILQVSIVSVKRSFRMTRNKASLFFLVVSALLLQALHTTAQNNRDECVEKQLKLGNINPTTDKSPFQIKLTAKTYSAKTAVKVEVEATGHTFKKILLYAVAGEEAQVGEWGNAPDGLKGATCQKANDAAVHSDEKVKKESMALEWTADKDLGEIEFRATVVEDLKVFYELKSEKITYKEEKKEEETAKPAETTESNASTNNLKIVMLLTNYFVFLAYFYM